MHWAWTSILIFISPWSSECFKPHSETGPPKPHIIESVVFRDTARNTKNQHYQRLCKFAIIHKNNHNCMRLYSFTNMFIYIFSSTEYESPWDIPTTLPLRIFWVAMLPVKVLLHFTVPDCRRPGRWRKTYPLTFIMSIVWIAAFSYVMVWMVTIAGKPLSHGGYV